MTCLILGEILNIYICTTPPKKLKQQHDSPGGNGGPAGAWTHMGGWPHGPGPNSPPLHIYHAPFIHKEYI